jgi:hypothetical protein
MRSVQPKPRRAIGRVRCSGQPVTATFGGDEAPQRVQVDQRG